MFTSWLSMTASPAFKGVPLRPPRQRHEQVELLQSKQPCSPVHFRAPGLTILGARPQHAALDCAERDAIRQSVLAGEANKRLHVGRAAQTVASHHLEHCGIEMDKRDARNVP
jgi:hypothetical protein